MTFDELSVGQAIPTMRKGPMTAAHIMRWSAASENWHRIHYDHRYATEHDKLPDVVINGSWKQHMLIQLLTDWCGEGGWLHRLKIEFRAMNVVDEILMAWGSIETLTPKGEFGVVDLKVGIKGERDVEGTPGRAMVILPRSRERPVPYPFNPRMLE